MPAGAGETSRHWSGRQTAWAGLGWLAGLGCGLGETWFYLTLRPQLQWTQVVAWLGSGARSEYGHYVWTMGHPASCLYWRHEPNMNLHFMVIWANISRLLH